MNYINPFNQLSGIYRILNKINGNCYIGSSLNVEKRYKHHLSTLRHNSSRCSILQKAFNKYGEDNFEFQVISLANKGRVFSKESKDKIRKAKQNTTLSQETIKKMSEAKKGKPWSEKRRAAYLKKTYNEQIS